MLKDIPDEHNRSLIYCRYYESILDDARTRICPIGKFEKRFVVMLIAYSFFFYCNFNEVRAFCLNLKATQVGL
jgi:hypothetical protein